MKLAVAAIYTNFSTVVIDDENIEATDAYTVKPRGINWSCDSCPCGIRTIFFCRALESMSSSRS